MVKFICNAFSLNMLSSMSAVVTIVPLTLQEVKYAFITPPVSAVGHADTAAIFSDVIGTVVPMNRATVSLVDGDSIIVGQYKGPRLTEGATSLPEGASIEWAMVIVAIAPLPAVEMCGWGCGREASKCAGHLGVSGSCEDY